MRLSLLVLGLLLSSFAHAQFIRPSDPSLGNINTPGHAVINTVSAVTAIFSKPDVPQDSISGVCFFKDGSCNGAQIELLKGERVVFTTTLASTNNSFKIPSLKLRETYLIKLNWPKHNLRESKEVTTGQYIEFSLKAN